MLSLFRRMIVRKRLERSMRPDPDYRERRLAQFTPARRARYWANVDTTNV